MAVETIEASDKVTQAVGLLATFLKNYGGRVLAAILVLVAGVVIGRWLGQLLEKTFEKKQLEPPVRMLIVRLARLIVLALAVVVAVQNLGVEVMPLVAGISVVGVGIGLAMQGMLSNVVAGLTIIFTRPFRVGEYIELLHVEGQVKTIELFSTRLTHPDRSVVVIPNRKIIGEILHNYGTLRQLALEIRVSYGTNVNQALTIIRTVLLQNARVLKDPEPVVAVSALAESSISISIKPWVAVSDYVPAAAEIYQNVVERFRSGGIEIPLPQREVRLVTNGAGRAMAS